jgi:predicted RNase H-like HicB family nuclease
MNNYTYCLRKEDTGFSAFVIELPGCFADGDTAESATSNLESAIESWITSAESTGYPIKPPFDAEGFTGKVALRMPRTLHKQAAYYAELEGCDLNTLLVTAISNYIGGMPKGDQNDS